MLIYRRTSLMEAPTQTLVNTVNCVGVMGKGIAKAFKEREPLMFEAYKAICDEKKLTPGKLWLWKGATNWVLNFPTKMHWRNPSRIEWVEAGLEKFVQHYVEKGITEVSFPRLGCGNGGLDWEDVRPLMEMYLKDLPINVYIHDYSVDIGLPEHLDGISSDLRKLGSYRLNFKSFMDALRDVLTKSGGQMLDLKSKEPLEARFSDEALLRVSASDGEWLFDEDDLRGIWLGLLKGLVTKEKAGWAQDGSGAHMISILGVLPQLRAVEIQHVGQVQSEIALELNPNTTKATPIFEQRDQREFSWH